MNLPPEFLHNIRLFPNGEEWLKSLPDLLIRASRRWDLQLGAPFLLSYNYVCAATRRDGTQAVLKVGVPNRELTSEINTLRFYNGQGACKLLEGDAEAGMLLLERLRPGTMLVTLSDDDQATAIAADLMKSIHRPVPDQQGFLSLGGWFDELKKLRPHFNGSSGPFPEKTFSTVESLLRELFAEERPQVLLHGDFHHFNILASERGWLVIDPKGVIGVPEYDAGPLLTNPFNVVLSESEALQRTRRRMSILCERLGFERQRLRTWVLCHCVLSSFWDMQEDGSGGESARAWAEIFMKSDL